MQGSIKTKVKGILAKIDTKNKKKQYRKSKIKVDEQLLIQMLNLELKLQNSPM